MMPSPNILIACVGNIFMGDDGFGPEVARRLAQRPALEGVRVVDFATRCRDLAYAMLDGYDGVILVDTTRQGGAPGSLYLIQPDVEALARQSEGRCATPSHGAGLVEAFGLASSLGAKLPWLRLVGCEPAVLEPLEDGKIGLSPAVAAAVDLATDRVIELVGQLRCPDSPEALRCTS